MTPIFRVVLVAGALATPALAAPPAVKSPGDVVGRGCPPERAQDGEVRVVFLGDSGYGTGVSEWGQHGQEAALGLRQPQPFAGEAVELLGVQARDFVDQEAEAPREGEFHLPADYKCAYYLPAGRAIAATPPRNTAARNTTPPAASSSAACRTSRAAR